MFQTILLYLTQNWYFHESKSKWIFIYLYISHKYLKYILLWNGIFKTYIDRHLKESVVFDLQEDTEMG